MKKDFHEFLAGKAKRLLIPYICLGIPLLASSYVTRWVEGETDMSFYLMVTAEFLLQQSHYTIWFLICLFLAIILLYGIVRVSKERCGWILGGGALAAELCIIYWMQGGKALIWNIDAALLAVGFMALGYWSKTTGWIQWKKYFKSWLGFFLAVVVYLECVTINGFIYGERFDMATCQLGLTPVSMFGIFCGIYCIVFFLKRINLGRGIEYLGQNTMVYFAWHQSIVLSLLLGTYSLLGWFTSGSLVPDGIRTILTVILIFVVLLPFDLLLFKTKLRFVVGK